MRKGIDALITSHGLYLLLLHVFACVCQTFFLASLPLLFLFLVKVKKIDSIH